MARVLAAAVLVALLAALLVGALSRSSGSEDAPSASTPFLPTPPLAPPRELVFFGRVASLVRKGANYELRVDPAAFLGGVTAYRAAVEDGVIASGDAVPNDHYTRDEGHRLLTYVVPPGAHVTVVTAGPAATSISVSELAGIVAGGNPGHRNLFEPNNGFWIRVATDTVLSMDQQYTP